MPSEEDLNKAKADSRQLPTPHIQGLDELFRDHTGNDDLNFPPGSTIVLSGPPGAGKTTMALALIRSMLSDGAASILKEDPADPSKKEMRASPKHIAYYISTEVNRERLKKMYSKRGWFVDEEDARRGVGKMDGLFHADPELSETSGLHVINPPLEIERPVKTSEELVNYIVRQIAVESPPKEDQKVFIIVDSVTALFKDCKNPGQGRRQTHELTHRLQQQFANTKNSLGLIILLAEQGIENMDSPGMETYVADFVFNLGFKSLTMGTRLRTVEITKSQGANLMMGTHTWLIVTNESLTRVIAGRSLQDAIEKKVKLAEGLAQVPQIWGTVVFLHRPYFLSLEKNRDGQKVCNEETGAAEKDIREAEEQVPPESFSGILGLDQMLKFDSDYWFSNPLGDQEPYGAVRRGSVTMLVGDAGTGKTSLCYHFVARHLWDHDRTGKALLVGFEQDFKLPFRAYGRRYKSGEDKLEEADIDRCDTIYRPRSGLHFNLLLMEIREWLKANLGVEKRIAIDGISNLASIHTRQEFSQMLDALIYLIDQCPDTMRARTQQDALQSPGGDKEGPAENKPAVKASLLLTYEAAQAGNIFGSEAFRLPADNIVMLEHKDIEDDRRTAVTVIKSSHQRYDTMVRELELNHNEPELTHIKSGFDAYSGLLSGKLQRATVVLQLFEENGLEDRFNKALKKQLRRLLPYDITLRKFSRFDISSTLDSVGTHIRVPHGDVLISNMDEWWLSHKVSRIEGAVENALSKNQDPKAAASTEAKAYQLVNLAGFVKPEAKAAIKPGDFWCFEMEKCWRKVRKAGTGTEEKVRPVGPYALPSFLDFGMFCIHRDVLPQGEVRLALPPHLQVPEEPLQVPGWKSADFVPWKSRGKRSWFAALLQEYLVPWCTFEGDWFALPRADAEPGNRTLVDLMHIKLSEKGRAESIIHGFAWDSRTPETAACVLYELAWAFGGGQALFDRTAGGDANQTAVRRALSFIGFLVKHGLMPVCPTLTDTSQAVFSRHYYSTFTDVNLRHQEVHEDTPPPLISLGFMPPGPVTLTGEAEMTDDEARFDRLLLKRAIPVDEAFKENTGKKPASLAERKRLLKKKWQERQLHLSSAEKHYDSPNPTDIGELIRWMDFREQLSRARTWDEALGDKPMPLSPPARPVYQCRTGHGCCGAWMVGVKGPAASPGLGQVVLQEITSLNFAKKRARMGAGIPARQDFYRYYGDRPVTGMEQFSWNEILCFLGSRANRRDRVYPEVEKADPAQMHKLMQHHLNRIMIFSAGDGVTPGQITELATQCTAELFEKACGH